MPSFASNLATYASKEFIQAVFRSSHPERPAYPTSAFGAGGQEASYDADQLFNDCSQGSVVSIAWMSVAGTVRDTKRLKIIRLNFGN